MFKTVMETVRGITYSVWENQVLREIWRWTDVYLLEKWVRDISNTEVNIYKSQGIQEMYLGNYAKTYIVSV